MRINSDILREKKAAALGLGRLYMAIFYHIIIPSIPIVGITHGGQQCDRGWIKGPGKRTGKTRARTAGKKDFDYRRHCHCIVPHRGHCIVGNYPVARGGHYPTRGHKRFQPDSKGSIFSTNHKRPKNDQPDRDPDDTTNSGTTGRFYPRVRSPGKLRVNLPSAGCSADQFRVYDSS